MRKFADPQWARLPRDAVGSSQSGRRIHVVPDDRVGARCNVIGPTEMKCRAIISGLDLDSADPSASSVLSGRKLSLWP